MTGIDEAILEIDDMLKDLCRDTSAQFTFDSAGVPCIAYENNLYRITEYAP